MHDAEAVGDEDVGEIGVFLGELLPLGVDLGILALVETDVLEEDDLAVPQRADLGVRVGADGVGGKRNVCAEKLRKARGHGREGELGLDLALGPAKVGRDDDARAGVEEPLKGGKGGANAAVVGDVAILVEWDVEVRADENLLAGKIAERVDGPHDFLSTHRCPHTPRRARASCQFIDVRASSPPTWRGRRDGWSSPTRCRTRRRPSPGCR